MYFAELCILSGGRFLLLCVPKEEARKGTRREAVNAPVRPFVKRAQNKTRISRFIRFTNARPGTASSRGRKSKPDVPSCLHGE